MKLLIINNNTNFHGNQFFSPEEMADGNTS